MRLNPVAPPTARCWLFAAAGSQVHLHRRVRARPRQHLGPRAGVLEADPVPALPAGLLLDGARERAVPAVRGQPPLDGDVVRAVPGGGVVPGQRHPARPGRLLAGAGGLFQVLPVPRGVLPWGGEGGRRQLSRRGGGGGGGPSGAAARDPAGGGGARRPGAAAEARAGGEREQGAAAGQPRGRERPADVPGAPVPQPGVDVQGRPLRAALRGEGAAPCARPRLLRSPRTSRRTPPKLRFSQSAPLPPPLPRRCASRGTRSSSAPASPATRLRTSATGSPARWLGTSSCSSSSSPS